MIRLAGIACHWNSIRPKSALGIPTTCQEHYTSHRAIGKKEGPHIFLLDRV